MVEKSGAGRMSGGQWQLAVCLVLVCAGCDTVAEISFEKRDFQGIATTGFIHSGDPADGICGDTDNEVRFNFAIFDGDSVIIQPNERLGSEIVEVSGPDTNFISEDIEFFDSFIYPAPDISCAGDGDCPSPFSCLSVNPFNQDADLACGLPVEIVTFQGGVGFDDGATAKSIALLMDYSGTLAGVLPDGTLDQSQATDPRDERISAARTFVLRYSRSAFAEDTRLCVVDFQNEGRAGVHFNPTPQNCLSSNLDSAEATLATLNLGEDFGSNVWSAILETVDSQLANAPGDRIMILFTDGGDDASAPDTFEDALNAVIENGVTVHVIHLDNPGSASGLTRQPLDMFAQLACETGGSYQYAQSPEDLRTLFQNLAATVGASYEVEAQIAELASGDLPADQHRYRVATGIRMTVANELRTLQLAGDKTDPATLKIIDDRMTVFVRPVPQPEIEPPAEEGTE